MNLRPMPECKKIDPSELNRLFNLRWTRRLSDREIMAKMQISRYQLRRLKDCAQMNFEKCTKTLDKR